jgi:hypothetical protein
MSHPSPSLFENRDRVRLDTFCITRANSQIANDDIVRIHVQTMATQGNAVTRRRLTGNSQLTTMYVQVTLEVDDARYLERHRTRSTRNNGLAQAPRATVFEVCHPNNATTATTLRILPESIGARKGGYLCHRRTIRRGVTRTGAKDDHWNKKSIETIDSHKSLIAKYFTVDQLIIAAYTHFLQFCHRWHFGLYCYSSLSTASTACACSALPTARQAVWNVGNAMVTKHLLLATAIFGLVSPALAQDDQSVNVDYY